jgi:hypothetical protein
MHAAIDGVRGGGGEGGGGGGGVIGGANAIVDRTSSSAPSPPPPATHTSSFVETTGIARGATIARVASFAAFHAYNAACVAAVSSGFFGACVASWMIRVMRHRIAPIIAEASSYSSSSSSSSSWMDNEYRWTALATLLTLLLPPRRPPSSHLDDAPFVVILWSYSHFVDPIFGGVLGIVHAFLGMTSTILGNAWIGNAIGRLGDDRYVRLDDDLAYVDPTRCIRPSRDPILLTNGGGRWGGNDGLGNGGIAARMASGMGSASLLVVIPRHFLGLYMLGTTLASLGPYLDKLGRGSGILRRTIGEWSRWWLLDEAGTDTGEVVGDGGARGTILPWRLSKRLLVLYWMITLSKAAVAYILM